jgi:hypothetical protein
MYWRSAILRNFLAARKTFDTSGKSPAHYHHRENRAEPAAEKSAAGFLFEKIPIGRRLLVTAPHLPTPVAWGVAGAPPSEPHSSSLAGTREGAGVRRGAEATAASGPCSRDTVRVPNDRVAAICRTFTLGKNR